jgi:Bacterial Ig-like domain (group 3)/PKD domain
MSIARCVGIAVVAILALSVWAPVSAYASGCEDSWTNTAGGSWFEGGNWSKKAPPKEGEEACITAAGTYTVTMNQTLGGVTVKSLTIGGSSGTQTLLVASTNSANAVLTTSAGITTGVHGAITLTNAETSGNSVTVVGPIDNAGTLTTEPAVGGQRNLQGNLTNTGTLQINTPTSFNASKAVLTNEGALDLATGMQLVLSNKSSATNGTNGKIAATGTGDVLLEPETSFTQGAGTTSGTKPVILRDAALHYTGTGASKIAQHGESNTLSGNLSSGQSLTIESTNGEHTTSIAAASFTNAGTITLTKSETNDNNARLEISAGTLTNSGTITSEGTEGTGHRSIEGNLTNKGTLNIDSSTAYDAKATLANEGTLNVATGVALVVSAEVSVVNAAGAIDGTGTGTVAIEPGTSFTEGAGTTSGTKPVIVRDGALHYTGTGASKITEHGEGNTLSGNLASGQALVLESTNGEHQRTTASASFTNAGTITLTKSEVNNNNARLEISSGTLTNTGTITSEAAEGANHRFIEGNLTNKGMLQFDSSTEFGGANTALVNEGTLEVTAGTQLTVTNDSSVTNGTGGALLAGAGAAVRVEPGGAFTEGAGTTSGSEPVILRDAALHYTGSGASKITQHGESNTLSGNLASGQSLSIQSTNSEHTTTTAPASFTNAGTITLTKSETNNNDARLEISAGTLTNSGTITSEAAEGAGRRTIEGNLTNTGTLNIDSSTEYDAANAIFTNEGTINLAEGTTLRVSNDGSISNGTGGQIAAGPAANVLLEPGSAFTQGAGTASGTLPVIIRDGALKYTGSGASTIAQYGEGSTLSGTISSGQTLSIQSTCSEHTKTTASASFTNNGTIVLTNSSTCGNNASLSLTGGTLTNKGTISAEEPQGGIRAIEGNLVNERTVLLGAGANLKVTGTYTQQEDGTLLTQIGGTSDFGALSVSESAAIAGTLFVHQVNSFKGEKGQKFAILSAASRSGKFAHTSGATIAPDLYYFAVNTATGTNLEVLEGEPPEKLPTNVTKPTISGGTQQGQTIVLDSHGTWTQSPGEFSYQWLRCEESGSGCKAIAGAIGRNYLLTGADAHHRITLQVTAYDTAGESLPAEPSSASPVISALPLHAAAGESISAVEGVAVTLDGSGSTPSAEISKYRWQFGDGAKEEGAGDAVLHHAYAVNGKYTATLTVFRGSEESSATVTITVTAKPKPAEGVAISVKSGGSPVNGATVLYVGSGGARIEATSGSGGEAVLTGMPEGSDTVYVYKSGLRPGTGKVTVNEAGQGSATVTLESGEIATAEVKSKELNYEEIVAAGINPSEPANQNVYKFVVKLAFIESPAPPVEVHGYVNSGGAFVGATGAEGGGGGWSCGAGGCEGSGGGGGGPEERIVAQPEVVEGHPLIQWLILHGKAAVLKQFFEVSMIVQNLSPEPFELSKGTATLNLPEGLSLAPTTQQQALTNEVKAVPGGGTATTDWIIRGDTPGEYNVSANYKATLEPFDAPVAVQAALANPLKVWGKEAMTLKVKADEGKLHAGVPYHVYVGVENKSNVPLYNVNLTIEETPHEHFIFQPEQQFSELVGELKPGETFFVKRPYILIPDNESESVFNPALSSATFVGEKEHPGENIEKIKPPTMYPLEELAGKAGYVHLKWTPVPGAEGYEVFSTKNLDTLFTNTPLSVLQSSSSTTGVTILPASATEAYVPASSAESLRYALSTIIAGHLELESSPVIEAFALAPTTVALTSSGSPSVHGAKVTFTAKVTPITEGGPAPTGTVEFLEGTTVLGSATPSNKGIATFSSSSLGAGKRTIVAAYRGDTHNEPSESAGYVETITKASTKVALSASVNPVPYGSIYHVIATVSAVAPGGGTPTGTVTFKEGATVLGTEAIAGGTADYPVKELSPGKHTITAIYNGDANDEPSSESPGYVETITKAPTKVVLSASVNPVPYGSIYHVIATVTAVAPGGGTPGGTVTFKEGATVLGTEAIAGGTADYPVKELSPGKHTITAIYNGDANDEPSSESPGYVETITKAPTKVVLSASVNPVPYGSTYHVIATVTTVAPGSGTPTGTLTFKEGTTVLGTETIAGDTADYPVKELQAGKHTITAIYNGDSNDEPSGESSGYVETITKASTKVALSASVNPVPYGSIYHVIATVTAVAPGGGTPTGTVTFKEGATVLGTETIAGGAADYPVKELASGKHTITAVYNGDANDEPGSESPGYVETIGKASTKVALSAGVNPVPYGSIYHVIATVTAVAPGGGTPTGTVTFKEGATVLGTETIAAGAADYPVKELQPGKHTITAVYNGDANDEPSSESPGYVETIEKASTKVVLSANVNPVPVGSGYHVIATVTAVAPGGGTPTGTVTFKEGVTVLGTETIAGDTADYPVKELSPGKHTITAIYNGDANNEPSSESAGYVETIEP